MITPTPRSPVADTARPDAAYVDWAAILAGAFVAYALLLVLTTFGAGQGLSMVSFEPGDGVSLRWVMIGAGIWVLWTTITSFAAGGYLAGRMRRTVGDATGDEIETRDGSNGLVVWAVGAVVAMVMGVSGAAGVVGTVASGLGTASATVAETMEGPIDQAARTALRSETGTVAGDPAAREEIASVLLRSLQQGEIAEGDRAYIASIVAANTDMDQNAARAQVDNALAEAEQTWEQTVEIADQARIASVIAAFLIAATLLASAAAAYFAAAMGGQHRDQNIGFRTFGR